MSVGEQQLLHFEKVVKRFVGRAKLPARSSYAKWREFHDAHPEVYIRFERMALEMSRRRDHYSARTIIHALRFHTDLDGRPEDEFKINNNWSPYYTRLFEEQNPALVGFFEKRKAIADDGE